MAEDKEAFKIHLEPIAFHARVFKPGHSYGDKYISICTVQVFNNTAFISGLLGTMNRSAYADLIRQLKLAGFSKMSRIRRGVLKITEL